MRRLREAEMVARTENDQVSLAQILGQLGRIFELRSDFAVAKSHYQECYSISKANNDFNRMLVPLNNLGVIAWQESDLEIAKSNWEEALVLARQTNQPRYEGSFLSNLSAIAGELLQFDEAISYSKQGLAMQERNKNLKGSAYCLLNLASIYLLQEKYSESLAQIENAEKLFIEIGDQFGEAVVRLSRGEIYLKSGNLTEAAPILAEMLPVIQKLSSKQHEMKAREHLSALFCLQGEAHIALAHWLEAAKFSLELKDFRQMRKLITSFGNIVGIYSDLKLPIELGDVFSENKAPHVREEMVELMEKLLARARLMS